MNSDLLKIKNKYGEKMAHLCRELFSTLFDTEGLLSNLILSNFNPSRYLYDDIVDKNLVNDFKNYIYSLVKEEEKVELEVYKTPHELLDEADYILYECKTEEDIQSFRKYYKKEEELCTFRCGRLETNYVFFAVKKNVNEIIRSNFRNPQRQDEYGTSVISIQFSRGNFNTLSIKNRYNHVVDNPDATFSNNLDNIILGLTKSFEQAYDLNIIHSENDFEIPGYVRAKDGKFYKYNYEINNIYYCPDNIIIDNFEVIRTHQEKERYIVFDYFILDMKEKKIQLYDSHISDSFVNGFKNIDKVEIKKYNDEKYICLKIKEKDVIITLNKENKIIGYQNDNLSKIGNNFLRYNDVLEEIYLEKVKYIGNSFLYSNVNLNYIYTPLLKEVGDYFLYSNQLLKEISMPALEMVGNYFLSFNKNLAELYMPELNIVGDNFLSNNIGLNIICFPNLLRTGRFFISSNKKINDVYFPNLLSVGDNFLSNNNGLKIFIAPKLQIIGFCFLRENRRLIVLELPSLEFIEHYYLENNTILSTVIVPEDIRNSFIYNGSFKDNFRTKKKKLGVR